MPWEKLCNLVISFPGNVAFGWREIFALLRGNLPFRWIFQSFSYKQFLKICNHIPGKFCIFSGLAKPHEYLFGSSSDIFVKQIPWTYRWFTFRGWGASAITIHFPLISHILTFEGIRLIWYPNILNNCKPNYL